MCKFIKICIPIVSTLVSIAFMFIPEALFEKYIIFSNLSIETNIIINRILFLLGMTVVAMIITKIYMCCRKKLQ